MGSFLLHKMKGVEMTEDNKNVSADAQNNQQKSDDNAGKTPKTYTEAEYKELQSESVSRRKKLEEYEAKLKALEDEKLTEAEKKEKELKDTKAKLDSLEGSIRQKEIDNYILKSMSGKNFIDNDAVELLIKKELASVEEITAESVGKITEKLIKDKPQLIASNSANPSDGNFGKQGGEVSKSGVDALQKLLNTYKG